MKYCRKEDDVFYHTVMTITKTKTNTKTKTKTMTKTKTFWEHLLRAILETCDLWDIWSEWWGDMTWPKELQRHVYKDKDNDKGILRTPSKAAPWDFVTFETFDQSDGETWHDQQRQRHSGNTATNTYELEVWNCCHFRQLRTWIYDNHCYLGIKSDTGQHSQFLRCFLKYIH